jgi:PAS domain S-box-containing protein
MDMLELFRLDLSDFSDLICTSRTDNITDLIRGEKPDVVITDYDMPDKNGLELLSEIKLQFPELPVIFYTRHGNEEIAREAFINGASDYFARERGCISHKDKLVNSIKKAAKVKAEEAIKNKQNVVSKVWEISRTKTGEEFPESEGDRLRNILNSLPFGVYITNNKYEIEYINPVIEREFGRIENRPCFDYFHGLTAPCTWCKNANVFAGKTVKWEWFSERKGSTYELIDMPFINNDGSVSKIEFFNDITESKKLEHELRKSEEMYRSFMENTQEAIYIVQNGIVKFANKNCSKITGISQNNIIGQNIYKLIPDEDVDIQKEYHRKLINKEIDHIVREIRFITPEGGIGWLSVNSINTEWEGYPATLNFATVITERKKAESDLQRKNEELEQTNRHLNAIIETIPDLLFELDRDGRYHVVSSQNKEDLFALPEYLIGKTVEEILPPDVSLLVMNAISESDKNGFTKGLIYSLEINGSVKWFDLSIAKKQGEKPVEDRFILLVRNITGRKLAEEAQQRAEANYRQLYESSMDAIFIQTPPHWKCTSANPAALRMFGFDDEAELINCHPITISPEQQPDGQSSYESAVFYMDDALKSGYSMFEWMCKRKDGSLFPASILLTKVKSDDKILLSATIRDITDMKMAENKLVEMNRELKDFAYRVAHELKNPVKIIKGYINILNEELGSNNIYLDKIDANADRLIQFIDDELKLAKTGQSLSGFTDIEIEKLLKDILKSMSSAEAPEITVDSQLLSIKGDYERIRQVFTNLLVNSIQYANPENEKVVIKISVEKKDGKIFIKFSDNGIGIRTESLEKIFAPGYTKGSVKGTGFGLAIVKKIIEAHGGKIWAESSGRKMGATFCIELPDPKLKPV